MILHLKALREKAGMSQRALAEAAGVSATFITMLETGRRRGLESENLHRLAKALGVTENQLVSWED